MAKGKKAHKATKVAGAKFVQNQTKLSTLSTEPGSPTVTSSQQMLQGRCNSSTIEKPVNPPKGLPPAIFQSSLPRMTPSTSVKTGPHRHPATRPATSRSLSTKSSHVIPNRLLSKLTSKTTTTPSRVKTRTPQSARLTIEELVVKTDVHLTPPANPFEVKASAPLHTPTTLLPELESTVFQPTPESVPTRPLPYTSPVTSQLNPGFYHLSRTRYQRSHPRSFTT